MAAEVVVLVEVEVDVVAVEVDLEEIEVEEVDLVEVVEVDVEVAEEDLEANQDFLRKFVHFDQFNTVMLIILCSTHQRKLNVCSFFRSFFYRLHNLQYIVVTGELQHKSEDKLVFKNISDRIPLCDANVYKQDKTLVGTIHDVLGPINEVVCKI